MKSLLLWLWKALPLTPGMRFLAMWLLNSKFLLGVIGVVVDDRGRVLLLKHSYRPTIPWGLPSGWVKRGEQPQEALIREIREETGLEVQFVSVLQVSIDPDYPRIDLTMLCRVTHLHSYIQPRDPEIEAAGFFLPGDFPVPLFESQVDLIRLGLSQLGYTTPPPEARD
jgi:8-oxo-dGTP diphosphatase